MILPPDQFVRLPGNENTYQAAKRGLQLGRIHTTVNASTFREQTRMKEQMPWHYNEQAYNDASQKTTMSKHTITHHNKLRNTDNYTRLTNSRRKLIPIPRKGQPSIWRLNMRCPTYTQVTTGQPPRYIWYQLHHCPAMVYWRKLMTATLTDHTH